jgi:DNA-binding NarL/FixJ family response regulator
VLDSLGKPPAIVIAESQVWLRKSLPTYFKRAGFPRTRAVGDGDTAFSLVVRLLAAHRNVILVADQSMPCEDGEELVLRLARRSPDLPHQCIVVGFSFAPPADEVLLHMLRWVPKARGPEELVHWVRASEHFWVPHEPSAPCRPPFLSS